MTSVMAATTRVMLIQALKRLVNEGPGRTATELARALYGHDGYQARVGPALRTLCYSGQIERRGEGGPADPYRYFPVTAATADSGQQAWN